MGRLTYLKNGRPCLLINGSEYFGPVAERLHAYEETGYEPGEVHDLADRIGKLLLEKGQRNLEVALAVFQKMAETSELAVFRSRFERVQADLSDLVQSIANLPADKQAGARRGLAALLDGMLDQLDQIGDGEDE